MGEFLLGDVETAVRLNPLGPLLVISAVALAVAPASVSGLAALVRDRWRRVPLTAQVILIVGLSLVAWVRALLMSATLTIT